MCSNVWKQFKLTITDPPSYKGHFELIQKHLIPFVEKIGVRFWVTNYFNQSEDFILFRLDIDEGRRKDAIAFLDNLVKQKEIVRWEESDWSPKSDASARITSASQKFGLPSSDYALKTLGGTQRVPFKERVNQLESFFAETIGSCTKVLYKTLKSKPTNPWMMSLLVHLVLNSLDLSGPNAPSEESIIRSTPVY